MLYNLLKFNAFWNSDNRAIWVFEVFFYILNLNNVWISTPRHSNNCSDIKFWGNHIYSEGELFLGCCCWRFQPFCCHLEKGSFFFKTKVNKKLKQWQFSWPWNIRIERIVIHITISENLQDSWVSKHSSPGRSKLLWGKIDRKKKRKENVAMFELCLD